MKLISKVVATALAASLIVPAAFAATTSTGTLAAKSHVAAMKTMKGMKGKGMKAKGMKGKGMKGKGMKAKGMKAKGMKGGMKKGM